MVLLSTLSVSREDLWMAFDDLGVSENRGTPK